MQGWRSWVKSPRGLFPEGKITRIKTRPVCVLRSAWCCTLEADNSVGLGFCVVDGLNRGRGRELSTQTKFICSCVLVVMSVIWSGHRAKRHHGGKGRTVTECRMPCRRRPTQKARLSYPHSAATLPGLRYAGDNEAEARTHWGVPPRLRQPVDLANCYWVGPCQCAPQPSCASTVQ